jgi:ferric iron reductase protein FhuF
VASNHRRKACSRTDIFSEHYLALLLLPLLLLLLLVEVV